MKSKVITGIFITAGILLLLLTRTMFIPSIVLAATALCVAVWHGVLLVRQKDIQHIIDAKHIGPFLASLLFLTLFVMAWLTVVAGLGHGDRASAVVHLKWLLTLIGVLVVPVSVVLFIRYYRIVSQDQRRTARRCAAAGIFVLLTICGCILARIAGWPPILYAARVDRRDLEKLLIACGVDVNVRDSYSGWDPLTYAAWRGDAEMAGLLLAAGARVYDATNNDWPSLVHASITGHGDVLKLLLERVDQAEAKNLALCYAARHGHPSVVSHLLDAGADMYAKGRFGRNALQEACAGGHTAVVRLLLERSPREVRVLDECGNALLSAAREEE